MSRRSQRARKTPESLVFGMGEVAEAAERSPPSKKPKTESSNRAVVITSIGKNQRRCPFCAEQVSSRKMKLHIKHLHKPDVCTSELFESKGTIALRFVVVS
jgi:hypothetical protein